VLDLSKVSSSFTAVTQRYPIVQEIYWVGCSLLDNFAE